MTAWQLLAKRGQTGVTDTISGSGGQELAYAETQVLTSTTSPLSSHVEIPGLVAAPTVADRAIMVIVSGLFYNGTDANGVILGLVEDAGLAGETTIATATPAYPNRNVSVAATLVARRKPSPGVHTYRCWMGVFFAGTAFANGAPGGPIVMEVFEV